MSIIAPEWRSVSFDYPERFGDAARWLTPGMPVWCARIDPAFTPGHSWYLVTRGADHEFVLHVPASFLADAGIELHDATAPPEHLQADLSHLYTKACERLYEHILAKYGTES